MSGYAFVQSNNKEQGSFLFEKGMLKQIVCGELYESAAFEAMSAWKNYKFLIARGNFNPAAAQFLSK